MHTHTHTHEFWLVMSLHARLAYECFSDELAVHSELAPLPCPTSIVGLDQCGPVQHKRRLAGPHQGFFQLLTQHLKRVQFGVQRSRLLSAVNDTDTSEQNPLTYSSSALKEEFRQQWTSSTHCDWLTSVEHKSDLCWYHVKHDAQVWVWYLKTLADKLG